MGFKKSMVPCPGSFSSIFAGDAVERFFDEVGESSDVIGVRVDGCQCHIANGHVFDESLSDLAGALFVGRHDVKSLAGKRGSEPANEVLAANKPRMLHHGKSANGICFQNTKQMKRSNVMRAQSGNHFTSHTSDSAYNSCPDHTPNKPTRRERSEAKKTAIKFNAGDNPARAVDSTQVKTADRGLGVYRLVLALIVAKDAGSVYDSYCPSIGEGTRCQSKYQVILRRS